MTDQPNCCETCKWWYRQPDVSPRPEPECRRHAPAVNPRYGAGWPASDMADWCGEWEAKAAEAGVGPSAVVGRFVTAKLRGRDDCRQGTIFYVAKTTPPQSTDHFIIRCEDGAEYVCEGEPTVVDNLYGVVLPPIKPCPCCGSAVSISAVTPNGGRTSHVIRCANPLCGLSLESWYGERHAIDCWNTRVKT